MGLALERAGSPVRATAMTLQRILVVDGDVAAGQEIARGLDASGYRAWMAGSVGEAESVLEREWPEVVLLSEVVGREDGLGALGRWKGKRPGLVVVVLTERGSIRQAVRAVKAGADDFLSKPVEVEELVVVLKKLGEREEPCKGQAVAGEGNPFVGTSEAIRELERQARRALLSESPILILGETGTGKGLLARHLHKQSPRSGGAFVDLNCAGLSHEFLETELFGHEKGAFTGATSVKAGLLEVAHQGTVFLDELGDMDQQIQPKLLKVLEEKRFRRVGSTRDQVTNVRLIGATHHDMLSLVQAGKFRADLYYRVSALPLRMPALRERVEDIPALACCLLGEIGRALGRGQLRMEARAMDALCAYGWPGNIRELHNVLERAALSCPDTSLRLEDLAFDGWMPKGPSNKLRLANPGLSGLSDGLPWALKDAEWERLERLFPVRQGRGGQWRDHRQAFEGILWALKHGAPWRQLPDRYGPWQTVYYRYNRWLQDGTLAEALARLGWRLDSSSRRLIPSLIDSQNGGSPH